MNVKCTRVSNAHQSDRTLTSRSSIVHIAQRGPSDPMENDTKWRSTQIDNTFRPRLRTTAFHCREEARRASHEQLKAVVQKAWSNAVQKLTCLRETTHGAG